MSLPWFFVSLYPTKRNMSQASKKAELGWVIFDWANSSYSLVISTAIFPTFFHRYDG
jgi:MFS-type transporter involved in bile tolerance (Atg22 family)